MTPQVVPDSPLEQHYRALRKMSQSQRLSEAEQAVKDPAQFAKRFARSVERFEPYNNPGAFYPQRREHEADHKLVSSTLDVVAPLAAQRALIPIAAAGSADSGPPLDQVRAVPADRLATRFIDRELLVTRTKDVEGWQNTRRGLRLDVLLADAEDGTPVVGELKLPGDMDPYFALVQSLACLAYLATANQRDRLTQHYGNEGLADRAAQPRLDASILLVRPPGATKPKGRYMPRLVAAAAALAQLVLNEPALARHVRRISCLALNRDDRGHIAAQALWAYEAPARPEADAAPV